MPTLQGLILEDFAAEEDGAIHLNKVFESLDPHTRLVSLEYALLCLEFKINDHLNSRIKNIVLTESQCQKINAWMMRGQHLKYFYDKSIIFFFVYDTRFASNVEALFHTIDGITLKSLW